MSTSHLFHAYNIRGYQCLAIRHEGGAEVFEIERAPGKLRCAKCGSRSVTAYSHGHRDINAGRTPCKVVKVRVHLSRLSCADCGCLLQEPLDDLIPHAKSRVTRALARSIVELRREMSIKAVADHFKLDWHTVKDIEKSHLLKKYRHIRLKHVKFICVDEIYIGHGEYKTVVRDYESGAVLHVCDGKGADGLKGFGTKLKQARARIKAAAMDMSNAFRAWIADAYPDADIIYDHFHVIKIMNEKLDDLRRAVASKATEDERKALKGHRRLFLMNNEELEDEDAETLGTLTQAFEALGRGVYLKERLRAIYFWAVDASDARIALERWCEESINSGLSQMASVANTISSHMEGILGYWRHNGATNAKQEGFNNKIRWLIRQAYGYHDDEYFVLKIYDLPTIKLSKAI